ncbi:MAG: hypothetical protein HC828_13135 [Blastochloris sp.]|nr:hypothetical protein [Blastochloris sp.]
MKIRQTLETLQHLAVREIGFCVGLYWRSVTGRTLPPGMVSRRCRLAYVLFSGFAPAERYHALLRRQDSDLLPRDHIRLVCLDHTNRSVTGVAVIAVVSPDRRNPEGFRDAPPHQLQPGYQRYFRELAVRRNPPPAWWDEPDGQWHEHDASATCPMIAVATMTRAWRSGLTTSKPSIARNSGGTAFPAADPRIRRDWTASRRCSPTPVATTRPDGIRAAQPRAPGRAARRRSGAAHHSAPGHAGCRSAEGVGGVILMLELTPQQGDHGNDPQTSYGSLP